MFSRIFFGLLGMLIAYLLLKYRYKIQEEFGSISWAETYLGSTEAGIFFIAILTFVLSLLYMTGMTNGVIHAVFGRIF